MFPTQWKDMRLSLLLKLKSTHMSTYLHQIQSSPNPIQNYFICICGLFYFCHSLHNRKVFVLVHFGSLHEHHAKTFFISIIGSILLLFDVELSVMMFEDANRLNKKKNIWIKWLNFTLNLYLFENEKKNSVRVRNAHFVWVSYQYDKISKRNTEKIWIIYLSQCIRWTFLVTKQTTTTTTATATSKCDYGHLKFHEKMKTRIDHFP